MVSKPVRPFCSNNPAPLYDRSDKDPKGFGSISQPEAKPPAKVKAASKEDMKWKLEPRDVSEWLEWVDAQKRAAGAVGA